MKKYLQSAAGTIDALGLRERILILLATVTLLFMLVDRLLYQPIFQQQDRIRAAIENLQQQLALLGQGVGDLTGRDAHSPRWQREHRIAELEQENAAMDLTLRDKLGMVVDPHQAVQMLRDILAQDAELTLLELTTDVAGPDAAAQQHPGTAADQVSGGYKQYRLNLRLEGSYLATLRFVRRLETLPWALFSDELDFAVQQYPRSEVTLKMFTLGMHGGAA